MIFGYGESDTLAGLMGGDSLFTGSGNSEARFDIGLAQVEVDSNGDGAADMVFRVEGMSEGGQLTASDFLWLV